MKTEISNRQIEIIEAAGKLLATSGISSLTIKNLAKEMQFSESAIYRHFTSKEEIIISMLNYIGSYFEELYTQSFLTGLGAADKFKLVFKEQFAFFKKHPHFTAVIFSDGLLEESEKINTCIANIMSIRLKYLLPIITEAQKEGHFTKEVAPEQLAHITMGAVRLLLFKWRMDHYKFDIQKEGTKLLDNILVLISKKHK